MGLDEELELLPRGVPLGWCQAYVDEWSREKCLEIFSKDHKQSCGAKRRREDRADISEHVIEEQKTGRRLKKQRVDEVRSDPTVLQSTSEIVADEQKRGTKRESSCSHDESMDTRPHKKVCVTDPQTVTEGCVEVDLTQIQSETQVENPPAVEVDGIEEHDDEIEVGRAVADRSAVDKRLDKLPEPIYSHFPIFEWEFGAAIQKESRPDLLKYLTPSDSSPFVVSIHPEPRTPVRRNVPPVAPVSKKRDLAEMEQQYGSDDKVQNAQKKPRVDNTTTLPPALSVASESSGSRTPSAGSSSTSITSRAFSVETAATSRPQSTSASPPPARTTTTTPASKSTLPKKVVAPIPPPPAPGTPRPDLVLNPRPSIPTFPPLPTPPVGMRMPMAVYRHKLKSIRELRQQGQLEERDRQRSLLEQMLKRVGVDEPNPMKRKAIYAQVGGGPEWDPC